LKCRIYVGGVIKMDKVSLMDIFRIQPKAVEENKMENNNAKIGWCCKCKKKVEIKEGLKVKAKRGFMLKGKCPFCNIAVCRILKKEEV